MGYLHLSVHYQSFKTLDPLRALMEFRNELFADYEKTASGSAAMGAGSAAEAKELQTFLYNVKNFFNQPGADDDLMGTLTRSELHTVLKGVLDVSGKRVTNNLFRTRGKNAKEQGDILEKDLAAVVDSVLNFGNTAGLGSKHSAGLITGGVQTNIGGIKETDLKQLVPQIKQTIVEHVGGKLGEATRKGKVNYVDQFVTKEVNMKIDVAGGLVEANIAANASPALLRIAELLKHAYFTAKNYASTSWDDEAKAYVEAKVKNFNLHLGSTATKRVMLDLLMTKYPYDVAISIYYYSLNTQRKDVTEALAQLRLIYELTGRGQTATDGIVQSILEADGIGVKGANYLVYNDPGSDNIYVRSTADLIVELRNRVREAVNKKVTEISKLLVSEGKQAF